MELDSAQEAFVNLLGQIKSVCKLKFLEWVHKEYDLSVAERDGPQLEEVEEEPDLLDSIALELRSAVPPTALAPGEQQIYPPASSTSDMNGLTASNTLHVDSFLYPREDDVDSLCEQLEISRQYCLKCGSWKTSPLNFISHSISKEQLKFIFSSLVPDLSGKTVVDIGSRLGPVLYGAYVYSRAAKIIGIEQNTFFSELQRQVVTRHNLFDRIHVVHSDVCLQGELLMSADVVVLNNVFEFFCSAKEQATIWEFLFQHIRKRGCLLITIPSIQDSCKHLTFESAYVLEDWVVEISTGVSAEDEDLADIHLYCVK